MAPEIKNQTEVAVDKLRQDPNTDIKALNIIRTVGEIKNSIDTGSMQVVLKDPIGNLGDAGLNDAEKDQFRTELLQILKDMDPAKLKEEMQKFNDRLKALSSKVSERIVGKAAEKIQQSLAQEKTSEKPEQTKSLKYYMDRYDSIRFLTPGDSADIAKELGKLHDEYRTTLESQISRLDAYLEGRDTTIETKAEALGRKSMIMEALSQIAEMSNDGFKVGQKIFLDGQSLGGLQIGDIKANTVGAYTVDADGGLYYDKSEAAKIQKAAGEVSILAIDPVKGVQLSGTITRENLSKDGAMTHVDLSAPKWYNPQEIHEMFKSGIASVVESDGKTPAKFEARDRLDQSKEIGLTAQIQMEKGGLVKVLNNVLPGTQALPQYSGIEISFNKEGKAQLDFSAFDQLNPQQQLQTLGKFKHALLLEQKDYQIANEPDLTIKTFLSAEKAMLEGNPDVAVSRYADFIKEADGLKYTLIKGDPAQMEAYKNEIATMREAAVKVVEEANKFSVMELSQVISKLPEEQRQVFMEFQRAFLRDGKSIEGTLHEVKDPKVRELIDLSIHLSTLPDSVKSESFVKMADLLMGMGQYDVAKYYLERSIGPEAASVRAQMEQEGKMTKNADSLGEKKAEVLKTLNAQIDEYLSMNHVSLNYEQLQQFRGELFNRFMAQQQVPDEAVYGRMRDMANAGLLKSPGWEKFYKNFDPAAEALNLSVQTKDFIWKNAPIIAAEIGIMIIAPHIGAAVASAVTPALQAALVASEFDVIGMTTLNLAKGAIEMGTTFVAYEALQRGALPVLADAVGNHETAAELRHITAGNLALDFALMQGAGIIHHKMFAHAGHAAHATHAVQGAEHAVKSAVRHILHEGAKAAEKGAYEVAVAIEENTLMALSQRAISFLAREGEQFLMKRALPAAQHLAVEKGEHVLAGTVVGHGVASADDAEHGHGKEAEEIMVASAKEVPGHSQVENNL